MECRPAEKKQMLDRQRKETPKDEIDKKEIKDLIEWCDEKGHSEHEILELICRIIGAKETNKIKKAE